MSLKKRLRVVLVCMALETGVLVGAPMRPEDIQSLLHQLNQPKLAQVVPSENDAGDDPPPAASG